MNFAEKLSFASCGGAGVMLAHGDVGGFVFFLLIGWLLAFVSGVLEAKRRAK